MHSRNLTVGVVGRTLAFGAPSSCYICFVRICCSKLFFPQLRVGPWPARSMMEAHEWRGSASPRGDHSAGTQGSRVGRRSRLVDVDREFRATDHQLVPDSKLEPRKAPSDKLASEHQAVPPLASAALRSMPLGAAEHDSDSRRSPLPGLGAPLPGSGPAAARYPSVVVAVAIATAGYVPPSLGASAAAPGGTRAHPLAVPRGSRTPARVVPRRGRVPLAVVPS